jgi:hypothetical protein
LAFKNAPTQDTYSETNVSIFREIALRDGGASGKDEDYLNVFVEVVKQSKADDKRKFIQKRSGSALQISSVASSNVRGMFFWADKYKLFYCVGRNVYVYNVNTASSTTLTNVFTTSSGEVGFCEFLYDDGTVKIIGTDGSATSGVVTIDDSNTVVTCSDADLPAHLPYPVFLDGYLFLAKTNSSSIYNCDNNDPLTWTPDTYINTEMEADLVVRIAKLNNYLIAFGKESIEYFWDAANAAPDSPLQRNDSPIKVNTYLGGLAKYGNSLFYIGKDAGSQPDVFKLSDFKIEGIGSPSISRYLNSAGDSISSWTGNIVAVQGHVFYLLNAGSSKSWTIDLDTGLTARWAFKQNNVFDMLYSVVIDSTSNVRTYFCLDDSTSNLYRFDADLYRDDGTNFSCILTTESTNFNTMNRKTMSRLVLEADRPSDNSNILVQWTDNDYQSYSTAREINLNQDLPSCRQLGTFRQRSFKLTYTDNYPMRVQDIIVNINKGAS